MIKLPWVIAPICLFSPVFLLAEEEIELPPIEMRSAPIDWLLEDRIRPWEDEETTRTSGGGTVLRDLEHFQTLPVKDPGQTGSQKQISGLGKSAEEFGVQTLGISLSPPQGGGFDFSTFPQFMWSGYRLRQGASLVAFDPRVTSGVLTLEPWTFNALGRSEASLHVMQLASNNQLFQSAVGYSTGGESILVGYSMGDLAGFSGSAGIRRRIGETWTFDAHVLATSVTSRPEGTKSFPTPNAVQKTARGIPFLRAVKKLARDQAVNLSLFHDQSYLAYDSSGAGVSRDRTRQTGADGALVLGQWRLGLSIRHIEFNQIGFSAPVENVGSALVSQRTELGDWTVEPAFQIVSVTGFDVGLGGGVGVRRKLSSAPLILYTRADFTRRYPTVANRYYSTAFSLPNPSLLPEEVFSLQVGADWKGEDWSTGIELVSQKRERAQVTVVSAGMFQVQNVGTASLDSIAHRAEYSGLGWLTVENSIRWTQSRVEAKSAPFPGTSEWVNVFGARMGTEDRWSLGTYIRGVSPIASFTYAGSLHGYWLWDLRAGVRLIRGSPTGFGLRAECVVENVLDSSVETVEEFFDRRRIVAFSLVGEM